MKELGKEAIRGDRNLDKSFRAHTFFTWGNRPPKVAYNRICYAIKHATKDERYLQVQILQRQ
jgi:hypothetical protein